MGAREVIPPPLLQRGGELEFAAINMAFMIKVFNQPKQKLLRQSLRKMPIGCERKLWSRLRNKQLGYKFFRQYGIDKYIIDFYCPTLKLAIEIDDATHSTDEEIKKDVIRQKFIENLGYWKRGEPMINVAALR